jgi:WD40 repeat protein
MTRLATLASPPGINDLTFTPDGTTVATAHTDGTVRLWESATGVERLQLHGHEDDVTGLAFSADGSKLASVGDNGLVRVWAVDVDDLLTIAGQRLTRGFSADECRQYLHTARCPTA